MTFDDLAEKRPIGHMAGWAVDDWTGRGIIIGYTVHRGELAVLLDDGSTSRFLDGRPMVIAATALTWSKPVGNLSFLPSNPDPDDEGSAA